MMWGYSFSGPGMLMMSLGAIIFIVLIAVLIWALVSRQRTNTTQQTPALSALETLRQRYAHGEIDAATFEQMRAQLEPREPVEGLR
jgi:putative membrane protein